MLRVCAHAFSSFRYLYRKGGVVTHTRHPHPYTYNRKTTDFISNYCGHFFTMILYEPVLV